MIRLLSRSCWDRMGYRVEDRLLAHEDAELDHRLEHTLAWTGRLKLLFEVDGVDPEGLAEVVERLCELADRHEGVERVAIVDASVRRASPLRELTHHDTPLRVSVMVFPTARRDEAWGWLDQPSFGDVATQAV